MRTLRLENGVQKFSAVLLEITCALEICEQPFRLQNPTSHTPWQPDNFLNFNVGLHLPPAKRAHDIWFNSMNFIAFVLHTYYK